MRRSPLTILAAGVVLALTLVGAATAGNGGLAPVTPRSPNTDGISDIYYFILGFAIAIFLLVETVLILFVLRFRGRGRAREVEGPQIRGNTRLELAWTAVPVLIVAAIVGFVFYKLPQVSDIPSAQAQGGRVDVRVEGRQFYWQFEYPNGVIAVDRLRAPVGRPVRLEITAPEHDVNHSWWIPALAGKLDAIPGETNETWFRAEAPGVYRGQCGEFCGVQHARMAGYVDVLPAEEFDAWLRAERGRQATGRSQLGEETYRGACAKCHGFEGEGGIGPQLRGNPVVRDRRGLARVVLNGQGKMPAVGKGWRDRQLEALARYMRRTLGAEGEAGGGDGGG